MDKQFRVALVGCGSISGNHISGILDAGEKLCALCDILPEHANQKAKAFSLEGVSVYTDYIEMLDCEKPDIVHICTPHDLHAPMAIAALERNINVLCEKPLCIRMKQLEDLRLAEQKSTAQLGVCHQNRWKPSMIKLKKMAEVGVKGAFGSVVWDRDEAYYRSGNWRGTWEREGGGVMINQALHTLDLLQWICGMPTHVTASIDNWHLKNVIEVEDTATARFECEGGLPINFFATTGAGASLPISVQMVLSDKRKVCVQNGFMSVNDEFVPMASGGTLVPAGKEVWGTEHVALISHFYHCVRTKQTFPIDVEEGGRVIRLILSMYQSKGERIAVLS